MKFGAVLDDGGSAALRDPNQLDSAAAEACADTDLRVEHEHFPSHAWQLLSSSASRHPARLAFVTASGVAANYGQLLRKCCNVASFLTDECGILPSDRVALLAPNCETVAVLHFAVAKIDAAVVNINTSVTRHELAQQLHASEATSLVVAEAFRPLVQEFLRHDHRAHSSYLRTVIWVSVQQDGYMEGKSDLWASSTRELAVQEVAGLIKADKVAQAPSLTPGKGFGKDDYQLYFTSGTTGTPKLIGLSHASVTSHAVAAVSEMRLHADDVWLHGYGLCLIVDVATTAISHHGAYVPPGGRAVAISNFVCSHYPIQSAEVIKQLGAKLGCEVFASYGMSECCGKITMSIIDNPTVAGPLKAMGLMTTSGRPFSVVDLRLVDKDGRDVQSHEQGEICCRGETLFKNGYRNLSESTQQPFPDGWFQTGDVGSWSSDNYIKVVSSGDRSSFASL
eukprot:scaffold39993_cov41-Prasinocladus_malaysianus.AAC.1